MFAALVGHAGRPLGRLPPQALAQLMTWPVHNLHFGTNTRSSSSSSARSSSSDSKQNGGLSTTVALAPGVGLASAVALLGFTAASHANDLLLPLVGGAAISGVPVALVSGVAIGNLAALPSGCKPGLDFAATQLLRAGVVCVGVKLRCNVQLLGVGF